ncbi:MAG: RHS repeat protein, partial [Chitinophagales bacterium]|nr:RHS repeat protein [Chitinophagales bacterium]
PERQLNTANTVKPLARLGGDIVLQRNNPEKTHRIMTPKSDKMKAMPTKLSRTLCLIFLLSFLFISIKGALAQASIDDPTASLLPPTPTASAISGYIDVPVSLHTGTPGVSIPLYTLEANGISVPISVSYQGKGVKVDEVSSWVGLGWSLFAGGMISRTVKGVPDEASFGFLNVGGQAPGEFSVDPASIEFIENAAETLNYDSEPDVFSYSFNGHSGKFVFGNDGEIVTIPYSDIKIEVVGGFLYGPTFKATTPDGLIYTFGERGYIDKSTTLSGGPNPTPPPQGEYVEVPTAWHLSKIENPNTGEVVNFIYQSFTQEYELNYFEKHIVPQSIVEASCCPGISYSSYENRRSITSKRDRGWRLASISSTSGYYFSVAFVSSGSRLDLGTLTGSNRLDRIEVRGASGAILRKFDFVQDFWHSSQTSYSNNEASKYRMYLTDIIESGEAGVSKPPYHFEYYNGENLPPRLSFSQDHWGYYNGANNYQYFTPGLESLNTDQYLVGADRSPNPEKSYYGSLKKIFFPTGASKEFVYEGNEIGVCATQSIIGDATVTATALWNHPANNPPNPYETTEPLSIAFWQQVVVDFEVKMTAPYDAAGVKIVNTANNSVVFSRGYVGNGCPNTLAGNIPVYLLPGDYEVIASVSHGLPAGCSNPYNPDDYLDGEEALITVHYQTITGTEEVANEPYGGIRIALVATDDNNGNKTIRKYKYTKSNSGCSDTSSGVRVGKMPRYAYTEKQVLRCEGFCYPSALMHDICDNYYMAVNNVLQSSSFQHLTNTAGDEVQYSEVWEMTGEDGEFGKTYNKFLIVPDIRPAPAPILPLAGAGLDLTLPPSSIDMLFDAAYVDMSWKSGLLLESRVFTSDDEEVGHTINQYGFIPKGNVNALMVYKALDQYPCPQPLGVQCDETPEDEWILLCHLGEVFGTPVTFLEGDDCDTLYLICYSAEPGEYIVNYQELAQYGVIFYKVISEWIQLQSTESSMDGAIKTTTYEYTIDGKPTNPIAESFVNSDGNLHRTEYIYAMAASHSACLVDKYMIGIPVEIKNNINGTPAGGAKLEYSSFGGKCLPYKYYIWEGDWDLRAVVNAYDSKAFPTTVTRTELEEAESYYWDRGLLVGKKYKDWRPKWKYYANSRLLEKFTDIDGQEVNYVYDGFQRLGVSTARGGNVASTYTYDYGAPNRITSTTTYSDAPTQIVEEEFDGLGRLIKQLHNGVPKQEIFYDDAGRIARETYQVGTYTDYLYEQSPLNRIYRSIFPDGNHVEQQYSSEDNYYKVTTIDEKGNSSDILTDFIDRQGKFRNAEGGMTIFSYDNHGDLASITDPNGSQYLYTYDLGHRVESKIIPGKGIQVFRYYPDNKLLQYSLDANG